MLTSLSRFENDELVKIEPEESSKTFKVQAALLRNASPYFEKALAGGFMESKYKVLRLPGCDKATFELFLFWLCKQRMPEVGSAVASSSAWQEVMVQLYAFADMCLIPELQNQAMTGFLNTLSCGVVDQPAVLYAFEHLDEDSIMRKAVVGEVVGDFLEGLITEYDVVAMADIPDFMAEFLRAVKDANKGPGPYQSPGALNQDGLSGCFMVPVTREE